MRTGKTIPYLVKSGRTTISVLHWHAFSRKDAQVTDATFSVTIQSSTVSIRRPYATDTMILAAYLEIRSVKSTSELVAGTKQGGPSDVLLIVFRFVKKFVHHDFGLEGLYLSI